MMGLIFELAFSGLMLLGMYFLYKFFKPGTRVHEYASWYKVARILQIADKKKLNLYEVMEKDKKRDLPPKNYVDKLEEEIENDIEEGC